MTSQQADTVSTGDHDAVIRVAADHYRGFDLAVIHCNTAQHDAPTLSLSRSFNRNPASTSRPLEALSVELLSAILLLPQTNRRRRGYLVAKAHCAELPKLGGLATSPGPHIVRYMASSSISSLDIATGEVQTGLSCKGCQATLEDYATKISSPEELFRQRGMVYSKEGQQCAGAKALGLSKHRGNSFPSMSLCSQSQGKAVILASDHTSSTACSWLMMLYKRF